MKRFLFSICVFCLPVFADDSALIRQLLAENLDKRTFSFVDVVRASTGKSVIPLDPQNPAHQRICTGVRMALDASMVELSLPNSPVRQLRRINEASRFFEDLLLQKINRTPGLRCEIPRTKSGLEQRSGYPDLKIIDTATGLIAYLDPKLVETGSLKSTLRTFYYEPKDTTVKINDDALHLLCGILHDGKEGRWTFQSYHLVDLSKLRVRLKAEFQASNADLYSKP
ncbi:MAG: hypothetical protein RLZZ553_1426 [Verrucomicrobiota bacterium]|jgi:hypothetical protein